MAVEAVALLEAQDFSFVKRDGCYIYYATLANHPTVLGDAEGCLASVMSKNGATKMVREWHWGRNMRPVRSPCLLELAAESRAVSISYY